MHEMTEVIPIAPFITLINLPFRFIKYFPLLDDLLIWSMARDFGHYILMGFVHRRIQTLFVWEQNNGENILFDLIFYISVSVFGLNKFAAFV